MQVAKLLGRGTPERINLSGSTSLEQLLGCLVPFKDASGEQQFRWQEGKLV